MLRSRCRVVFASFLIIFVIKSPSVLTQDDIDDLNGPLSVSNLEILPKIGENETASTINPEVSSTILLTTTNTPEVASSTTGNPDVLSGTDNSLSMQTSTVQSPDTLTPSTTELPVTSTESGTTSSTSTTTETTETPIASTEPTTETSNLLPGDVSTLKSTEEPGVTMSSTEKQPEMVEDNSRKEKGLKLDENDLGSLGPKSCSCQDGVVERKDPASCFAGRVTTDLDCSCRQVCARQAGQSCGSADTPCDVEFGLKCNSETKTCHGKLFVQSADVTHTSVTLRWRSLSKFAEIPQAVAQYSPTYDGTSTIWSDKGVIVKESTAKFEDLRPNTNYYFRVEENGIFEVLPIRTKDGCLSNNSTESPAWVGLGENYYVNGCDRTCTCREGGQSECHDRCQFRPGSLKDPLCEEVPDPDDACCVMYKCLDREPLDNAKVLVTQRTPSSLTLAWDDFKLPNYESGYVVEYRQLEGDNSEWEQVQAGNIPLMSITKLKPHTAYQVKVMVWEDAETKKRGSSSEVVTVYTEDGCVRNNQTLAVGAEFFEGCDLACTCRGKDEGQCRDRCSPPYYRAGTLGQDPLCTETPLDADACCVTVRCTQEDNLGAREGVTFAEKSGSCPEVIHVTSKDNQTDDKCPKECTHDHECGSEGPAFKCCPNYCGGMTCTDVAPPKSLCDSVFCGANARCVLEATLPKCICDDGFGGDPNSIEGCQKSEPPSEKATKSNVCTYGNETHSRGEQFFVGCDLRCTCGDDLEVSCSPRCVFALHKDTNATEVANRDPLCDLIADPLDSCCMILACESIAEHTTIVPANLTEAIVAPDSDTTTNGTEDASTTTTARNASTQRSLQMDETTTINFTTESSSEAPMTTLIDVKDNITTPVEISETTTVVNPPVFVDSKPKTDSSEEAISATTILPETTSEKTTETIVVVEETTSPISLVDETVIEDVGTNSTVEEVSPVTETSPKNETANDLITGNFHENESPQIVKTLPVPTRLDGCEYNGKTYTRGENFEDGCEARCTCVGPGRVTCVPRCPLIILDDNSSFCHEQVDPNDSCCKIMICERPGDTDVIRNAEGLKLIIDSVEAQNATTVRLRLTLAGSEMVTDNATSLLTSNNAVQVWYAPSKEGSTDNDATWKKESFKLTDLRRLSPNVFQVDIRGLEPDTEYFFKVRKHVNAATDAPEKSLYSNTVNVKTFSKAVQAVFKGCFHRNATYEIGQVFYDGCQYKCVCQEKGLIQCQDRCEQYLDTVGYEHCRWAPAPDDPCCTIPYCDGDSNRDTDQRIPPEAVQPRVPQIPNSNAYCMSDEGFRHALGDTWELGEGCTRKVCTCAMRSNGTTVIECNGGCSPIPASVQHPTPDCPQPVLVTPEDPCLCPYILCNNAVNPLSVPTPMCDFKGRRFHVGEEFYDSCRAVCQCGRDLRVNCAQVECPHHFPAHVSECLEWEIDPDFVPTPPKCCPPAKCKNDGSCRFNGMQLSNFQHVPQELLDCGTRCVCVNGNVTCEQRCPQLTSTPPPHLNCPPSLAYKGRVPGDPCCQHWICRPPVSTDGPNHPPVGGRHDISNVAIGNDRDDYCQYNGKRYRPNEQWEARKGSLRRLCTCRPSSQPALLGAPAPSKGQRSEVDCEGGCPVIPDRFRLPSPQCPRPVLVTPDDPVMCPYVVCNNSLSGKGLENVSFVPINSTAIRVRFSLPSLLVGLAGHAELRFTSDPNVPRDSWHVQKFARPQRLFDTANIEYHLAGLRPGTVYFFQVSLVIDALQSGPESEVFKLKMPADNDKDLSISETSTAGTSSTLPPMILVDATLTSQPLKEENSIRISWRPFEAEEKKFIDGVRLKYKMVPGQGSADSVAWKSTPMIHRDVTSYVIRDLQPGASYQLEMELAAPDHLSTHLVSTKMLEFKTPPMTQKTDMSVSLKSASVGSFSTDLEVQGVPTPYDNHVNVAKVTFKSDTDADETRVFKSISSDGKIPLDHLKPGRRYKVWVDLYLTNGKTVSSKVLEVMTKAAPPGVKIPDDEPSANLAEALQRRDGGSDEESKSYYIALIVVAVIAAVAALGFVILLVILLRRQSSAKAPITRSPSEAAYDNPTYKTYDAAERHSTSAPDHVEKNGNGVQPC